MSSADSPGHSILRTEAILIFDLDGTVLSVNSFPYWVRYMLTGYFGGFTRMERLILSLRTVQVLFARKLLGNSHYHAKRKLQMLWTQALEKDAAKAALHGLNVTLQKHIRPNMRSLIAAIAEPRFDAILATSAAGEYAQGLGKALGFMHILATPLCTESDTLENRGERKCERAMALLAAQGWSDRMRFFFTDHKEDLPLIRQCHRIFWFGRDEDAAGIQADAPLAKIIPCRSRPDAEIMQLVTPGRPASSGKSTTARRYG